MSTVEATEQHLDAEWVEEFAARWLDAWNSHDADRLLGLMTEGIVYDDSGWPKTMRGHADVREFVEHAWRAFPDMTFEEVAGPFLHPTRAQASFQWRGWGTHTGPIDPPGVAPTGRRWETEGADFHTYRDGKVARLVIVFNAVDVMRQLGSLPEPGSAGERVAVALGNLQTRLRRK